MRIAVISTGLGRVRRGFESFSESLFLQLRQRKPDLDVRLFQGGRRSGDRRHHVQNFHRADVPARWLGDHRANLLEKRSFALALYPRLRAGGYQIVHYNELTMGSALYHLRRLFGGSFRLLYCNGAPSPPVHYHHRCDAAQVLTQGMYEEAVAFGMSDHRLFLVPYGVDAEAFKPVPYESRKEIRTQLGIPADAFVVLSVAAIKREHKRIDYLIREVAGTRPDAWLLVAGQVTADTPYLEQLARKHLQDRWRFISWPHENLPMVYGAADVFVLASLTEGFGIVLLEAMATGLPTVAHDAPLFRWVTGSSGDASVVDMSVDGALRARLQQAWGASPSTTQRAEAMARFSWESLLDPYVAMYDRVAALPPIGIGPRLTAIAV